MQNEYNQYQNPNSQPNNQPGLTQQKAEDPGYIWALLGIIVTVCGAAIIGAVLSAIGYSKSKAVGMKNTLAVWGMILGVVFSVLGTIILVLVAMLLWEPVSNVVEKCNELGPGTHEVDGATYTCESSSSTDEFNISIGG